MDSLTAAPDRVADDAESVLNVCAFADGAARDNQEGFYWEDSGHYDIQTYINVTRARMCVYLSVRMHTHASLALRAPPRRTSPSHDL